MATFNNAGFDFSKLELRELAGIVHAGVFNNPELTRLHDVVEGIIFNEQIVIGGEMGYIGQKVSGCKPNEIDGTSFSEKVWEPIKEDFRLTHCHPDEVDEQDKLFNQYKKIDPDYWNIIEGSQSGLGAMLVMMLEQKLNEEILRKVWFNDKDAKTYANGGTITNGTDIKFFNSFNGFFKQLIGNSNITRVTITANSGTSYAAQEITPDDAFKTLKKMYAIADDRLIEDPNTIFYVTKSIYEAYADYLDNVKKAGAGNTAITEDGVTTLRCKGIELVKVALWDRVIKKAYDNGTITDLPNRAVLSNPMNLKVGVAAKSDFGSIKAFYAPYERKNVIDGAYSLDAKAIVDHLTVVAY